ncbi:unnamed protein product [Prorocentrum cordatum]|uniref:TauD/TfdA-like domain-containing protein n=1 Tax=Prorocentrum cordatum TaxID=2364126 RepID=A0ABN9Y1V6_9DINO|nr:unnamed protein product [Polarella glacialis]
MPDNDSASDIAVVADRHDFSGRTKDEGTPVSAPTETPKSTGTTSNSDHTDDAGVSPPGVMIRFVNASDDSEYKSVNSFYHAAWLRATCMCSSCHDVSEQRLFLPWDVMPGASANKKTKPSGETEIAALCGPMIQQVKVVDVNDRANMVFDSSKSSRVLDFSKSSDSLSSATCGLRRVAHVDLDSILRGCSECISKLALVTTVVSGSDSDSHDCYHPLKFLWNYRYSCTEHPTAADLTASKKLPICVYGNHPEAVLCTDYPAEVRFADLFSKAELAKSLSTESTASESLEGGMNEIKKVQYNFLKHLIKNGVVCVTGVPNQEDIVTEIASRIGPVQSTIYGDTFKVEAKANPENIAYSPLGLALHMDLLAYEGAPGIQLLHCREFDSDIEGGYSLFADAFAAAHRLRAKHPEHFQTLTRVYATFHKNNKSQHMVFRRPHIVVDDLGNIVQVNWSPPCEGPLQTSAENVIPYLEAYKALALEINELGPRLRFRLEPGTCVVFLNRQMLHAREEYFRPRDDAKRLLQGCYVSQDDFLNRYRILEREFGGRR